MEVGWLREFCMNVGDLGVIEEEYQRGRDGRDDGQDTFLEELGKEWIYVVSTTEMFFFEKGVKKERMDYRCYNFEWQ